MTRLVLPIEPQPAARPRAKKGGRGYYPAKYSSWLEGASLLASAGWQGKPMAGPVRVALTLERLSIIVEVEASDAKRGRIRGDIDNIGKAVLDVLKRGGVLSDDSQVVELSVRMDG